MIDFDQIFQLFPAPCLILMVDTPKFTIAEGNDAYLKIANIERVDLIGRSFFEAFPADGIDRQESLEKVITDKLPHQTAAQRYRLAGPHPSGITVKYFDTLNVPVVNSENAVEYIIHLITDVTGKKIIEQRLSETRDKFQSLIQSVDGVVWEADANTFAFTFISDKVTNMLGYTPGEWLGSPDFWKDHIYPEDQDEAVTYCQKQTQRGSNHEFDYRMIKANGEIIWIRDIVSVLTESGRPKWLRGLMLDITKSKRLADLDHLEKMVLELSAQKGAQIEEVLLVYLRGMEGLFDHRIFSIMQIKNKRLHNWAAPSLPEPYLALIENAPIGPNAGSCGTAAYFKEIVIVSDIEHDPRWADYKQFALPYNLHACWSYPILGGEGDVMAVFGVYYGDVKEPGDEEVSIIERAAAILKIIIENRLNADIINETALLMTQGQELANFGNWQWDIQNNIVSWSDTLYNIYGLDKRSFKATFEGYQELLHPNDRERVYHLIQEVMATKKDVVFEERILRPNGEIRFLKSWGRLNVDETGTPVKMVGACLDITDGKIAESKLNELHNQLEEQLEVLSISEKQYSDLFHLSPQPMWIYDYQTLKFLNVNDSAISHYGYTREEFLQMTIKDIRPKEEIPQFTAAINAAGREKGKEHIGVFKHRKKNGEIIQVDIQSNIIEVDGKKCSIVLANDITERQDYIEAIESKNNKLQEIAWIQSHVVRAPLARVMSLTELLKDEHSTGEENDDLLEKLAASANQLDQIIRDISDRAEEIRSYAKEPGK